MHFSPAFLTPTQYDTWMSGRTVISLIFIYMTVLGFSCGTRNLRCIMFDLSLLCTDSLVVVCQLSSCSMRAELICGNWLGIEPAFPTLQVALQGGSVVKNLPANTGDIGLIPGLGRSPGKGNGNPLQYSCLEKNTGIQKSLAGYSSW